MKVSFKANVKINSNLYKGLSEDEKIKMNSLVDNCKKLMEVPKVKELTEGDTFEISRGDGRGQKGFPLRLTFDNESFEKPIEADICGQKLQDISTNSVFGQIYLYLYFVKLGRKPRFTQCSFDIMREVMDLIFSDKNK